MKQKNGIVAGLVASLLLCSVPAEAAEVKRVKVTAATVKQKIKYFGNLVTKGRSAKAIEESNDVEAKKILEMAKSLLIAAQKDIESGHYQDADAKMNKALVLVRETSNRLGGGVAKKERLLVAFNARNESVTAFLKAYERVASEKKAGAKSKALSAQVKAYVSKAEKLVAAGKIKEGRVEIERAYTLVTSITAQIRQGDTLVRELKFDTPKDEYIYELDRNESLLGVLRMVLKEKKQNPKFVGKIEEYKQKAQDIRVKADAQGETGDYKGAMKTLNGSNKALIKAIRMGGLFIPG